MLRDDHLTNTFTTRKRNFNLVKSGEGAWWCPGSWIDVLTPFYKSHEQDSPYCDMPLNKKYECPVNQPWQINSWSEDWMGAVWFKQYCMAHMRHNVESTWVTSLWAEILYLTTRLQQSHPATNEGKAEMINSKERPISSQHCAYTQKEGLLREEFTLNKLYVNIDN